MWLPIFSLEGLKYFCCMCLDTGNSFLTNLIMTSIVTETHHLTPPHTSCPFLALLTENLGQFNSPSGAEIGPESIVKEHPAFKRQPHSACRKSLTAVKNKVNARIKFRINNDNKKPSKVEWGSTTEARGLNSGWNRDTVTGSSRAPLSLRPCSVNKQTRKNRVEAPTRAP